jgi:hypothetical protein
LETIQFVERLGNRANINLVRSARELVWALVWQGKLGDVELTPEQAMKAGELYGLLDKRADEMAGSLIEVK